MCKVLIINRCDNYRNYNCPKKEFDIPNELVPVLQGIFRELNQSREVATEPIISIQKI